MIGPIIMSRSIAQLNSWRSGYLIVTICQTALILLLFFTLPVWEKVSRFQTSADETGGRHDAALDADSNIAVNQRKRSGHAADPNRPELMPPDYAAPHIASNIEDEEPITIRRAARMHGVKLAMAIFFFYCGIESSVGLWGSSFLINQRGLDAAEAAGWISLFYASITLGRFVTGFLTLKISNKRLIRLGEIVVLVGIVLFFLPLPGVVALVSLFLIGTGCAPIFPCMLHQTPAHFGKRHAPFIMGLQMASAYLGITIMPPLLGLFSDLFTIGLMPFFLLVYVLIMVFSSEQINRMMKKRSQVDLSKPL